MAIRAFLWLVLAFFCVLTFQITWQYVGMDTDVGFLRIKQHYLDIDIWRIAFYTHVFTSMFALVAGLTQFSSGLLRRWPMAHRAMGYAYVGAILFFSGTSGLVMAFYANGGWVSKTAFLLLSVLWIWFTARAWQTARRRDWAQHAAYMTRSYALTLSAVTLRVWKPLLFWAFSPPPMDLYRLVAWLGWLPNLLLAEWLIRRWYLRPKR